MVLYRSFYRTLYTNNIHNYLRMTDFRTKIQSLQQSVGVEYTKPDLAKLEQMINKLRGSPGYKYLTEERGLNDETIEHFRLGYDASRNAIAIPHFKTTSGDGSEELINIKYRFLKPKDVRYTSEPNAEQWVYNDSGMQVALSKGAVFIAEGEMDCMSLWQAGIKNVISPGSGANSYGTWIELLDKIRSVWLMYDNDEPGQAAVKELADRIGIEKCRNVLYPDGIKDANEFIKNFKSAEELSIGVRELCSKAKPFYKYEFSGLGEVIQNIIDDPMEYLEVSLMPDVKLERDNLVVVTGETNAGKSTYSLNIIKELADKGVPTLFLPIERGVYSLGRRFLQIVLGKTQEEMQFTSKDEWRTHMKELAKMPVYMAKPTVRDLENTIIRAKKMFGIRLVIIDHMDYLVRGTANKEALISEKMHELKHVAEQNGIIVVVISHINRGAVGAGVRPTIKNLKGSSSLEQDSEVAIMLYASDDKKGLEVDVQKNKGMMSKAHYAINVATGRISGRYDPEDW